MVGFARFDSTGESRTEHSEAQTMIDPVTEACRRVRDEIVQRAGRRVRSLLRPA